MRNRLIFFVIGLFLTVAFVNQSFSGTTGKINGVVTDRETGDPLPGANVIIEGTMLGAATDLKGFYIINNIPPGKYNLKASMIGFGQQTVTDVKVSIDLTTEINFQLGTEVLELGREVVVQAERPIVQKDLTSSQASVSSEEIEALPVQDVNQVLQLQAGVLRTDDGIHIRGGRASEVAYYVDGISVTDAYNNRLAVEVENASVQELQVISGTFNAEYGQAMSGIVNIVTKDGGNNYHGNLTLYSGDYVSDNTETFFNIDNFDPSATHNVQGTLSGPVPFTKNNLKFFATGRYYNTDGYIFGQRRYNIDGTPGDNEIVPLSREAKYSGQLKLTYQLFPGMTFRLSGFGSTGENNRDNNDNYRDFQFLPDARKDKFDEGYNLTAQITHALNSSTFYTFNVSRFYKGYEDYVFEDPIDSRFVPQDSLDAVPVYNVKDVGTILEWFRRNTYTFVSKFDITSQLNKYNQLKFGAEFKRHKLTQTSITPVPARDDNGVQIIPLQWEIEPLSSQNHSIYTEKPIEFSTYVQDKIEYQDVIVNIGLRFDYFNARSKILKDPSDPNIYSPLNTEYRDMTLEEREQIWWKDTTPKYQVSPRFGIAYPITDKGAIHFSYGHFLQIPSFNLLFDNPGFKVPATSGIHGVYGNPDLEPQRTVMYEIGLQQQVGETVGIDITGFYRDVRDWVGVSAPYETVGAGGQVLSGRTYFIYTNRDYANIRGITFSMSQRVSSLINYSFDYTFQKAENSNSQPDEEFNARQDNDEPTRLIYPADWDQTHTVNGTMQIGRQDWGVSLLGRYGSGKPYTPSITRAVRLGANANLAFTDNSRRKPIDMTFDLRAFKAVRFGGLRVAFQLSVFNLFDRMNEYDVYGDTGRATTSSTHRQVEQAEKNGALENNTAEEYLAQPGRFSPPREIHFGIQIDF